MRHCASEWKLKARKKELILLNAFLNSTPNNLLFRMKMIFWFWFLSPTLFSPLLLLWCPLSQMVAMLSSVQASYVSSKLIICVVVSARVVCTTDKDVSSLFNLIFTEVSNIQIAGKTAFGFVALCGFKCWFSIDASSSNAHWASYLNVECALSTACYHQQHSSGSLSFSLSTK